MKQRLITLLLAAGALALFYALFLPKPLPADLTPALPTSVETGPDGYQAAWRWLQQSNIPVLSFRDHYDKLAQNIPAPTGNVLIVNLPLKLVARFPDQERLRSWIGNGNTLLIMAALDDTPRWATQASNGYAEFLENVAGIKVTAAKPAEPAKPVSAAERAEALQARFDRLLKPETSELAPNGAHPLFDGVSSVATSSEFYASHWSAESTDGSAMLALALALRKPAAISADADADATAAAAPRAEPVLWLKRHGEGQVILCAYASPFTNRLLATADDARLFANLVGWSRSAAGAVLFDDAHQGLVDYYDANAFYADPRLRRTLLWILLLWLIFVLGWQRLRAQADAWQPVDVTTVIRVTGDFVANSVTRNTAAERLLQNFFNAIRRRRLLPENGEPVWDWLRAQARIGDDELRHLQELHRAVSSNRKVDLVILHNLLNRMTSNMA